MGARLQGHSLTPAPGVHCLQGAHPPRAGWSAGLRGSRVRQAGLNATWEMRTQRWLPSWASLSSPALREASSSVMRTYSSPRGGPGGEEYRPANDHIVSSEAGSSATQATTASPATAWRQPMRRSEPDPPAQLPLDSWPSERTQDKCLFGVLHFKIICSAARVN